MAATGGGHCVNTFHLHAALSEKKLIKKYGKPSGFDYQLLIDHVNYEDFSKLTCSTLS